MTEQLAGKNMVEEELNEKERLELAIWLKEVFPKKYKMADYIIRVDTRDTEFCIMIYDKKRKSVYFLPETNLRHILSDIEEMKKKGLREFEPVRKLGTALKEVEE